ncbi:MAG: hypothetical protein JST30_13680 [Armatimonadetes bacterium]|nr:hypothetical protein [Armatimonadota bacterium]
MVQYKRIGEMLLDAGLITPDQLDVAMKTKMGSTLRFGEILTALGFVSEEQVTQCLADQYGYRLADLTHAEPEKEALELVPSITALSGLVLPMKVTDDRFYCIIADPLDIPMTDSLFRMAGRPVEFALAPPSPLFDAISNAYGLNPAKRRKSLAPDQKPRPIENKRVGVKRKMKIDKQEDTFALLAALGSMQGAGA